VKFLSRIIDFIFPPKCPVCGESTSNDGLLCAACWGNFNWISDPKCAVCGYPFPANIDLGPRPLCPHCAAGLNELDWMRCACVYDEASKNVMLPFKHANALRYKKLMSNAMIACLFGAPEFDLILPVPISDKRLCHRGYNQAALLAQPISKKFNKPIDYDSVMRKYRPDMGHKTAKQRAENIKGVFKVAAQQNIRDKTILLVDDVMTTGATFTELRKVLKRAGAVAVYGVAFCRVVRVI
jgi:ComF family protein